jgi:hypothetical protein
MIKSFSLLIIFLMFFSGCSIKNLDEAIIILEKNKSIEPSKFDSKFINSTNVSKFPLEIVKENISINESKNNSNIKDFPVETLSLNISSRGLNVFDKWQWQLSEKLNFDYVSEVDVYNIDLFDSEISEINFLHKNDIFVICYFSGGSSEDWRSDFNKFDSSILGKKLDGWDGERWLDISNFEKFSFIMESRFDLAVLKGCDGVEVDNVDGYLNNNGFGISFDDQLKYNIWLSEQSHNRDLKIGLKNDLEQVSELVSYFDFAVNEQCFEYDECELLLPFIDENKPVFGVEYELSKNNFCDNANKLKFSFLKMNYDLDGERDSCN